MPSPVCIISIVNVYLFPRKSIPYRLSIIAVLAILLCYPHSPYTYISGENQSKSRLYLDAPLLILYTVTKSIFGKSPAKGIQPGGVLVKELLLCSVTIGCSNVPKLNGIRPLSRNLSGSETVSLIKLGGTASRALLVPS